MLDNDIFYSNIYINIYGSQGKSRRTIMYFNNLSLLLHPDKLLNVGGN